MLWCPLSTGETIRMASLTLSLPRQHFGGCKTTKIFLNHLNILCWYSFERLAECYEINTNIPRFQSFSRFFA